MVLVEDPTYVGALNTFEAYQVEVATVPMDEHGLVPDLLEARIAALQTAGKNIKFLYTIPNFNNPSGITLAAGPPAEDRRYMPQGEYSGSGGQPLRPAPL